eukprot:m.245334 g.245334  ORF g.245334 m.245334 type:complete len:377 (-) comp15851_c0_seq6:87-1217(-)
MHLSRVMTAQVSRAFHETQFLSTFCQQKLTTIIGHLFSSPDFVGRDQFLDAEGQIPSSHRALIPGMGRLRAQARRQPTRPVLTAEKAAQVTAAMKRVLVLQEKQEFAVAEKLCTEVMIVCRIHLGDTHRDSLIAAVNLGLTLRCLGKNEEALAILTETVATCSITFGSANSLTLTAQNNLAMVLSAMDEHERAVVVHREVIATSVLIFGHDDPRTLTSLSNLAQCLKLAGGKANLWEAMRLEEEVLDARRSAGSQDDLKVLEVMAALGRTLYSQGKLEEAESIERQVLAETELRRSEASAEMIRATNNLAVTLIRQSKTAEAETLWRRATHAAAIVHGPESEEYNTMVAHLKSTLSDQGKVSEMMRVQTAATTFGA